MSRCSRAREVALNLFDAALGAVDPRTRVRRAFELRPDLRARVEGARGRLLVVGFGKAVVPMASGICDAVGRRADAGLLISASSGAVGHSDIGPVRVRVGGHPTPSAEGVAAATELAAMLAEAGSDDVVVALISGGGSSLGALPRDGVSLEELVATTAELLLSGAPIAEVNARRSAMVQLAAGGLDRLAAPAAVVALVLSDVPGDDLSVVASGPTVGGRAAPECVNLLVGCNATARHAAASFAASLGFEVELGPEFRGEARALGLEMGQRALESSGRGLVCIRGGETTVHVTGRGLGGRNHEVALAAAIELDGTEGVALLAAGTDGSDGPTGAAGAVVDGGTLARIRSAGVDPRHALFDNDSATALAAAGDQLVTGPTGTNVADLVITVALHGDG